MYRAARHRRRRRSRTYEKDSRERHGESIRKLRQIVTDALRHQARTGSTSQFWLTFVGKWERTYAKAVNAVIVEISKLCYAARYRETEGTDGAVPASFVRWCTLDRLQTHVVTPVTKAHVGVVCREAKADRRGDHFRIGFFRS
jgi:hypothetical protein